MSFRISRLVFEPLLQQNGELTETTLLGQSLSSRLPPVPLLNHVRFALLSDESLVTELQLGNPDALTPLFQRHGPLLLNIARRILRNDAEAEDAVQQVFLDVFRSIHQFDPGKARFKTWLLIFAYHRTLNRRRALSAGRFYVTDAIEPQTADASYSQPLSSPHTAYSTILTKQLLKGLQPRQRRTIELVYYEGLTAEEVAAHTGESVRVVRHNLYRGLEKIRKGVFRLRPTSDPRMERGER